MNRPLSSKFQPLNSGLLIALALSGSILGAQTHVTPGAFVSAGAYYQKLSDGYGPWRGYLLDASWNPHHNGKYIASVTGYTRPEGNGAVYTFGKYQEFKGGYGFLSLGTSSGADYLPTFQITGDLNVNLPWAGLVIGGGAMYATIRDGHKNTQFSLGPTLYYKNTITTLRGLVYQSDPGKLRETGGQFSFRHGADDRKAWQSLRVNWGGEAYHSFVVHESVHSSGMSAALDTSWPIGQWNLQLGVEFARKYSHYDLFGGSVRVGRYF